MTPDVSRDPEDYIPTVHLQQRMKERNIGWFEISKAIEDGSIRDSPEPGSVEFRLDFPGETLVVVAGGLGRQEEMKIQTAHFEG